MSVKILRASAGSGKTYALTREYIRLLLASDGCDAYRGILAVTFTNKATAEMKQRIIRELHRLATDPGSSPYLADLVPGAVPDTETLARKAQDILAAILDDYSGFSVSTIDAFFQKTLRAFARENGLSSTYQVELDRDTLLDETVDRLLGSLSEENPDLMRRVVDGVRADLETSGRFTLDRKLRDMAGSVASRPDGGRGLSREGLDALRDACEEVVTAFPKKVRDAALAVMDGFQAAGIELADTNRGFMKAVLPYSGAHKGERVFAPTPAFISKAEDPAQWFVRAKAHLVPVAASCALGAVNDFVALFGEPYRVYVTAWTLRSQLCPLGLAGEMRRILTRVQRDRNVITVDDTNAAIREIIGGADPAFVYEKTGQRYGHFLLDEFQDTSAVQWDNFRPLLEEASRSGGESLLVGDVKQSIYRWRGSDSRLLGRSVQEQLGVRDSDISVLRGNWRTCHAIVEFNNDFFSYAAAEADRIAGTAPEDPNSVSRSYLDVIQTPCTADSAPGEVDVRFVDQAAEPDEVVAAIRESLSQGAAYGDIAVLVRGNAEGASLASRLVADGIPVMSDDALFVKASVTVRRLVSQLAVTGGRGGEGTVEGFLAAEAGIDPDVRGTGLFDVCEDILAALREADPETLAAETAHIQAFMDYLSDYLAKGGGGIPAFLRDWDGASPRVAAPAAEDAVRVMTVHKSKGLEFPVVILPYAEKMTLYKPATGWCRPDTRGTVLEGVADGEYSVTLSEDSRDSLFKDSYEGEKKLQAEDAMNIMYVAMTRAKNSLRIIASKPPKVVIDAVQNGSAVPARNLSQVLYAFTRGDFHAGEPYMFTHSDGRDGGNVILSGYPCGQSCLKPLVREDAAAFFLGGEEEAPVEEEDSL